MNKALLTCASALLCTAILSAQQYYGNVFWSEGFDSQEVFDTWTINVVQNTLNPDLGEPELPALSHFFRYVPDSESGYSAVDPTSKGSVAIGVTRKTKITLESPDYIDATDKESIVIGVSGRNVSPLGAMFGFRVYVECHKEGDQNDDGSDKWENMTMNVNTKEIPTASPDWTTAYEVPMVKYAGTKFKIRLVTQGGMVDCEDPGHTVYLDGLYVAEKPAVDAEAKTLNPSGNSESVEPVEVSLRVNNNGTADLTDFNIWYAVDGGEKVTQKITETVLAGKFATFTFDRKADLSAIGHVFTLTAGVEAEGDGWAPNNETSSEVTNILTSVPYAPDFGFSNGIMKFENDGWTNPSVRNGRWITQTATDVHYWRANMSNMGEQEGYLISRPIVVEKGKALKVNYTPSVDMKEQGDDKTKDENLTGNIRVFYSYEKSNASAYKELATVQGLNYDLTPRTLYFTPEEDGVMYLIFQSASESTSWNTQAWLRLQDISLKLAPAYDLEVLGIVSPVPGQDTYSAAEEVKVSVANNGTKAAEDASIALYVDGEKVATEALPAMQPDSSAEYTFEYHPALLGAAHVVKAQIEWSLDENADNNAKAVTLEPKTYVNLAVVSIDGPRSGELTDEEHVVATVANNGRGDLENVEAVLTVVLGEGAPVEVKEVVAEKLAEGESVQYTFKTPVDFSAEGTYSVEVRLDNALDCDPSDNVKTTNVNCTYKVLDAGVDAVVGPTDRRMTGEEYLVVSVRNYGEADLYDVPVKASVIRDGETLATVEGHVSSVAVGESAEYTFPTPVDLARGGEYTVQATTLLAKDGNPDNDAYTGSIYSWLLDCGVEAIVSPAPEVVAGSSSITVRIRNYGDDEVSGFPVYFRLGTNPQRGNFEGTIAAGESAEYTFPSTYNFRAGQTYNLVAYTAHPEDMDASNDQCTAEIRPVKETDSVESLFADGVDIRRTSAGLEIHGLAEGVVVSLYDASGLCAASCVADGGVVSLSLSDGVWYLVLNDNEGNNKAVKFVK